MACCQDEDRLDLTGQYVLVSSGSHYKTGQVIGQVSLEAYLVRFAPPYDCKEAGNHAEIFLLDEMTETLDDGYKCWTFYQTQEELDTFVRWLETPPEDEGPKVVNLKPKSMN